MSTGHNAPFSDNDPAMAGFLWRLAADWRNPHAMVARNFLLDKGVADWRFESYRDTGAQSPITAPMAPGRSGTRTTSASG